MAGGAPGLFEVLEAHQCTMLATTILLLSTIQAPCLWHCTICMQVERPMAGGAPGLVEVLEAKGLDMVRRDWSTLSKETGNYVLQQILSGAGGVLAVTGLQVSRLFVDTVRLSTP
mgnify:CR=1 FL=1